MKPMNVISEYVRGEQQADALKAKAKEYAYNIDRISNQVGDHMRKNAELATAYGRDNLLAQLPPNVAANIAGVEAGLTQAWGELSDDPIPELPAQPVVQTETPAE